MVRGESYYRKFQPPSGIDLTNYSASYELTRLGQPVTGFAGALTKTPTYFELSFGTATLNPSDYQLRVFVTYPDGFIDCINDEVVRVK